MDWAVERQVDGRRLGRVDREVTKEVVLISVATGLGFREVECVRVNMEYYVTCHVFDCRF